MLLPRWSTNELFLERFAREARVLVKLKSPHVGHLIDVGNLEPDRGNLPYLVLEFLEGTDLDRLVTTRGPANPRDVLSWCADACDGVFAAHELGIVHRDLKPSNVFLSDRGKQTPLVKVLDFGIAAGDPVALGVRLTHADEVLGSPAYMSPEQMIASSDVDPRTDVWGMGVVLFEMLSGKLPFNGRTPLEVFANTMAREPTPLSKYMPGVDPEIEEIVSTCLQKDRDRRFPSMDVLAKALRVALVP